MSDGLSVVLRSLSGVLTPRLLEVLCLPDFWEGDAAAFYRS
jgi:hypothetical protein